MGGSKGPSGNIFYDGIVNKKLERRRGRRKDRGRELTLDVGRVETGGEGKKNKKDELKINRQT